MPEEKKRSRNYDKSPEGIAYRNKYANEHYDRLNIAIRKGLKAEIDRHAHEAGISISAYVTNALDAYMNKKPD